MTMWPAIGDVEHVIMDIHRNHQHYQCRALSSSMSVDERKEMGTVEMGMKTADTQTELIDESSPNSPLDFQIINENISSSSDNNNKERRLNINSLKEMKDLKCIDDDTASGHRILFTPDNPETKL